MKNVVTKDHIYKGMQIQNCEGIKGVVRNCEDLHNVHITFEGKGIEINFYETPIECGGSGFYCFVDSCTDKDTDISDILTF